MEELQIFRDLFPSVAAIAITSGGEFGWNSQNITEQS